jgi:hypothetical protein
MEERIIAFIDVLGFSNDVKSSSDFERIIKILDKVSAANTEGHVKKLILVNLSCYAQQHLFQNNFFQKCGSFVVL